MKEVKQPDSHIEEGKEKIGESEIPPKQAAIPVSNETPKEQERKINKVYLWGIGNSYVLGTKDEDTRFTPYLVSSDMYKDLSPLSVSCGTLHVVVRAITADEKEEDFDLDPKVHEMSPKLLEESQKAEPRLGKKRKYNEMEQDSSEGTYMSLININIV